MIPVTTLNFTIATQGEFDLGRAPGSSLRGALYAALATLYDTQQVNRDRADLDSNPVGWLLRLEDESVSGGHDVPRPFSIRPPLVAHTSELSFGLSFYGRAHDAIAMVCSAVPLMGQVGVGRRRQAFTLRGIDHVDPITGQATRLLDDQQATFTLPQPPDAALYERMAGMMRPDQLSVTFLTPTRIVAKGRLVHQPLFRPWFQRLLDRIRTLSEVYTEHPVWIPFGELLAQADAIQIVADQTRWYESWSGSRRDGMVKPLGGFVGRVAYAGDVSRLLPYLILGQALQVGKNTIKGCGWYQLHYHWGS